MSESVFLPSLYDPTSDIVLTRIRSTVWDIIRRVAIK